MSRSSTASTWRSPARATSRRACSATKSFPQRNDPHRKPTMKPILKLAAVALALATAPLYAQQFHRLESAVTLKSAQPDWDYVTLDPARGHLFIGRRGEGVVVYDVRSKKVIRTLDQSGDANAVTLVPEFDRGYSTNGDGTTTVFEISTLKTLDRVKIG